MKKTLALAVILCAPGCSHPGAPSSDSGAPDGAALRQMRELLSPIHTFEVGHLAVAAHTDPWTAFRIRRYAQKLIETMRPFFRAPEGPVKVYVLDTKENLAKYANAICEDARAFGVTMGFYHEPTRSVLCSMEWGLGWLGDLIMRSFLADDWRKAKPGPGRWFRQSFVSMLYNSFRTPRGDFEGLNVMSYYRPQVQQMIAERKVLPFAQFFRDQYDEEKLEEDAIRKQGREFIAYLHARGLLMEFYRTYREMCSTDPTGIRAIEAVLGKPLEQVEKDWTQWLMAADGEIGTSAMAKPFPVLGVLIERKGADDRREGAVVFLACPSSPAARAGLRQGDRILRVNQARVDSRDDLVRVLDPLPIDTTVTVELVRDGGPLEIKVTLDRFIDG